MLKRDLCEALARLNPELPESAREEAFQKLTQVDYARSMLQHNQQFYKYVQVGVPVEWRDATGETHNDYARVIDFRTVGNNRFLAVREMRFQGQRVPHYNRRADIVCFVNGLPLVFIELKAVYRNIRQGFDNNLTDYMTEQVIPHVLHHRRTNPALMDFYRRYQEIIADYNREKDRTTVEQTFAALVALAESLDEEQRRAVEEGLTEKELALFDLLRRENLTTADRERVKQASKSLVASIQQLLAPMGHWTRNAQTQAELQASILDWLFEALPRPPFTDSDTESLANRVYEYVWQQSEAGRFASAL